MAFTIECCHCDGKMDGARLLVVEAEVLDLYGHRREGGLGVAVDLIAVGEDISQPEPSEKLPSGDEPWLTPGVRRIGLGRLPG